MKKDNLQFLLKLARESINSYYSKKKPDTSYLEHLNTPQGVFVTLHKNGQLRGCIGYPEPYLPLYEAVIKAARSAALQDPRFPPVTEQELNAIKIELSVLTVPKLIEVNNPEDYPSKIKIGEDGLIIKSDKGESGLLLPQVATEHNFTVNQFLTTLCQKAGLSFNAWRTDSIKLYKFQAEIISE